VHKWLAERIGDPSLAAFDLTQALASGKLHCQWRRVKTGWTRELTPTVWWADWEFCYLGDLGLCWRRRGSQGITAQGVVRFFLWQPDIDKLWPPLAAKTQEPEPEIDERGKPGPRIKKDWKLHVAGELHRIVMVEKKPPPTADELAKYCHKKMGYLPETSEVSRLIRLLR
jgi:hypothetical protein